MSTTKYYPNWPNTVPEYDVGSIGFEPYSIKVNGIFGTLKNVVRATYNEQKGSSLCLALARCEWNSGDSIINY